jgi:hypothetical protein
MSASAPTRRLLADGTPVSREAAWRDERGRLCAGARLHARFPRVLRALAVWADELERKTGGQVSDFQLRRPIGAGARCDVRVRLRLPEVPESMKESPCPKGASRGA